ncbi:MAG: hypothetical protein HOE73_08515 [Bacteroidetes Order II. Incertae sedis bacterium]|jgi:hypothetical protein|nr:hypothetical protein [Bacteroidetes Order II. bacterium]
MLILFSPSALRGSYCLPRIILLLGCFVICSSQVDAQSRGPVTYSAGIMVGTVNGVSVKGSFEDQAAAPLGSGFRSIDINLSSDLADFVLSSAHIRIDHHVLNSPLTTFLGPGMTLGVDENEIFWGPSGVLGFFFSKGPYEVFLQLMPRLTITPKMDGRIESAAGLRLKM